MGGVDGGVVLGVEMRTCGPDGGVMRGVEVLGDDDACIGTGGDGTYGGDAGMGLAVAAGWGRGCAGTGVSSSPPDSCRRTGDAVGRGARSRNGKQCSSKTTCREVMTRRVVRSRQR